MPQGRHVSHSRRGLPQVGHDAARLLCFVAAYFGRAGAHEGHEHVLECKKKCCPQPRPNALPGPGGPGRTWGGAGQGNLAFLIAILRSHLLTYIWRWSRCLGRCPWALPLPCSFLRPCRALPTPFPRLSGPLCPALFSQYCCCLPPAFLQTPYPSPVQSPLREAGGDNDFNYEFHTLLIQTFARGW